MEGRKTAAVADGTVKSVCPAPDTRLFWFDNSPAMAGTNDAAVGWCIPPGMGVSFNSPKTGTSGTTLASMGSELCFASTGRLRALEGVPERALDEALRRVFDAPIRIEAGVCLGLGCPGVAGLEALRSALVPFPRDTATPARKDRASSLGDMALGFLCEAPGPNAGSEQDLAWALRDAVPLKYEGVPWVAGGVLERALEGASAADPGDLAGKPALDVVPVTTPGGLVLKGVFGGACVTDLDGWILAVLGFASVMDPFLAAGTPLALNGGSRAETDSLADSLADMGASGSIGSH